MALAGAHATIASPLRDADVDWIASAAARIGDADLLLEAAGVVFAFQYCINRIADAAPGVRLEYGFLRELGKKPIRGSLGRASAGVAGPGLVYDLSHKHQAPSRARQELLDRVGVVFERLGAPAVPDVFRWLSRAPVVLEGVLEMIEVNVTNAEVRFDLLREAAAIAVASRAMPGSGLSRAGEKWLSQGSMPDLNTLRSWLLLRQVSPPIRVSCRRVADIRGRWRTRHTRSPMHTDPQDPCARALGRRTPRSPRSPPRYSPRHGDYRTDSCHGRRADTNSPG